MPCDTIQTSQVNFNMQATDLKLLKKALEGLGYTVNHDEQQKSLKFQKGYGEVSGTFKNGQFKSQVRSTWGSPGELDINEIKRSYSKEVVKSTGNRFGWKLKETAPGKFQAQKNFGM